MRIGSVSYTHLDVYKRQVLVALLITVLHTTSVYILLPHFIINYVVDLQFILFD